MHDEENGAEIAACGQETGETVFVLQFYGTDDYFRLCGADVFPDRADGLSAGRGQQKADEYDFYHDIVRMRGFYPLCNRPFFPA